MSLIGHLEELGLGEILQIVSLSRKTGILSLQSRGRHGSVFFRQGLVVRATSSTYQQSLAEILIQKGVLDPDTLRKALAFHRETGFHERLEVVLVNKFGISHSSIEEVVRQETENAVFTLFSWTKGTFEFNVQNSIDTVDGTKNDPMLFMLDQGLNPQFLAMEGSRILDENPPAPETDFSEGDSPDAADFDFNLVDSPNIPASPPRTAPQQVVIVDDDGPTLQAIAAGLTENGFVVHVMTRSEDTLIKVDSLHRSGEHFAVLIDLIMPKMDGSGVLGGIELLELLHNNFKNLQLMIMTDYHHAEAENKIKKLGYPFIVKPRRIEINIPAIMESFLTHITHDLRYTTEAGSTLEWGNRFNLGDELRIEMGDEDYTPSAVETSPQNGGFSLLRGMLEELNNPDLQGGVMLLVLRFASEFVNRAIIFTLNNKIISGFGQFGITGSIVSGNDRVRSIQFPQESGSMFDEPLRTGQPCTLTPIPTPMDSRLFEQLGDGIPTEVFIGPLVSKSHVIGFLYGDNLPDKKPVGDIEQLAIFLSQAGISMERSLLERQRNVRGAL